MKEIAPSDELRKWFCHDPAKWEEFKGKYLEELKSKRYLLSKNKQIEKGRGTVTFLYAARDRDRNNAVILESVIKMTNSSVAPRSKREIK